MYCPFFNPQNNQLDVSVNFASSIDIDDSIWYGLMQASNLYRYYMWTQIIFLCTMWKGTSQYLFCFVDNCAGLRSSLELNILDYKPSPHVYGGAIHVCSWHLFIWMCLLLYTYCVSLMIRTPEQISWELLLF